MKKAAALALLLGIAIPPSTSAQSLKDAETVFSSGNWKVLRSINLMDDSVHCTGIYQDDYSVQLSDGSLYLGIQGGVQAVTLRFDEDPPGRLRLATKMEKDIRSVIITGKEFSRLESSSRLRYQVSTLVRGLATGELDLNGFSAALDNIRRKCPATSTPESETNASTLSPQCTPTLIANMQEQGLSEEQIRTICK